MNNIIIIITINVNTVNNNIRLIFDKGKQKTATINKFSICVISMI